jgi:hypothetical protein
MGDAQHDVARLAATGQLHEVRRRRHRVQPVYPGWRRPCPVARLFAAAADRASLSSRSCGVIWRITSRPSATASSIASCRAAFFAASSSRCDGRPSAMCVSFASPCAQRGFRSADYPLRASHHGVRSGRCWGADLRRLPGIWLYGADSGVSLDPPRPRRGLARAAAAGGRAGRGPDEPVRAGTSLSPVCGRTHDRVTTARELGGAPLLSCGRKG